MSPDVSFNDFLQKHDFDHFNLILFKRLSFKISFSDFEYLFLDRIIYPYRKFYTEQVWPHDSIFSKNASLKNYLQKKKFCGTKSTPQKKLAQEVEDVIFYTCFWDQTWHISTNSRLFAIFLKIHILDLLGNKRQLDGVSVVKHLSCYVGAQIFQLPLTPCRM